MESVIPKIFLEVSLTLLMISWTRAWSMKIGPAGIFHIHAFGFDINDEVLYKLPLWLVALVMV
jgi:hypothetical protein